MSDADRPIGIGSANGSLSPSQGEFEAVFEAMQSKLDQFVKLPLIQDDSVARSLLDDMARGVGPEELLVLLDRLDARVKVLLAQKARSAPSSSARRERPPRTLLRL
jgi:hypothetical protein